MYRTVHEEPALDGLPPRLAAQAAACLEKDPESRPTVAALTEHFGAPAYADWLPGPVTAELRRLAAELGGSDSGNTPATGPSGADAFEGVEFLTDVGMSADPPATAPPPERTSPRAAPEPLEPTQLGPRDPARSDGAPRPTARGTSRRRVLAALAATGVAAGGGVLAWTLLPEDERSNQAAKQPAGGARSRPAVELPQQVRKKGVLTVGTDLSYAPMEFLRNGEPAGVNVDIAEALGRELDIRFEFENREFTSLFSGLKGGEFDLAMSAKLYTAAEEGRPVGTVSASGMYEIRHLRDSDTFVVPEGNPQKITHGHGTTVGKVIAAMSGTWTTAKLADDEKVQLREFDSVKDALGSVASGECDMFQGDYAVAAYGAATYPGGGLEDVGRDRSLETYFGILVAEPHASLCRAVQRAFDRVVRSGEYRKILKRWHVEDIAVPRGETVDLDGT
ncbi:transporter substrate-binding domain-containing protein [Streptomyces xiaopingdaonensis]|uniref:transporter substrate-binding domain-containing protein n=1 Tax=Streptomyces xiaopingdaonensis TaxID=1565415 RepID=UPI00036F4ABC